MKHKSNRRYYSLNHLTLQTLPKIVKDKFKKNMNLYMIDKSNLYTSLVFKDVNNENIKINKLSKIKDLLNLNNSVLIIASLDNIHELHHHEYIIELKNKLEKNNNYLILLK